MTILGQAISYFPPAFQVKYLTYHVPILTEKLRTLKGCKCSTVEVNGEFFPQLTLSNGVLLVGYPSSRKEKKLFKFFSEKIGLLDSHIALSIDSFARFKPPHMAVGFDKINGSKKKRRFFHPQHHNLAQECDFFSVELKNKIKKIFEF